MPSRSVRALNKEHAAKLGKHVVKRAKAQRKRKRDKKYRFHSHTEFQAPPETEWINER